MLPSFVALSAVTTPVGGAILRAGRLGKLIDTLHKTGKVYKIADKAGKVRDVSKLGMAVEGAAKSGALFAAHGAVHELPPGEEGALARAKAGAEAVPMGMAFGAAAPLAGGRRLAQIGTAAGIGAGATAIGGGTTEDILIQGGLLGAMSAMHISVKDAHSFAKQIAGEINKLPAEQRQARIDEVLDATREDRLEFARTKAEAAPSETDLIREGRLSFARERAKDQPMGVPGDLPAPEKGRLPREGVVLGEGPRPVPELLTAGGRPVSEAAEHERIVGALDTEGTLRDAIQAVKIRDLKRQEGLIEVPGAARGPAGPIVGMRGAFGMRARPEPLAEPIEAGRPEVEKRIEPEPEILVEPRPEIAEPEKIPLLELLSAHEKGGAFNVENKAPETTWGEPCRAKFEELTGKKWSPEVVKEVKRGIVPEVEEPVAEIPPVEKEVPVEPVRPEPVEIPELKNTEEAIAFGITATPKQIKALEAKRDESLAKTDALKAEGNLQGAMDEAFRGQFFREAVASAEGKITEPPKLKPKEPVVGEKPKPKEEITAEVIRSRLPEAARSLPVSEIVFKDLARASEELGIHPQTAHTVLEKGERPAGKITKLDIEPEKAEEPKAKAVPEKEPAVKAPGEGQLYKKTLAEIHKDPDVLTSQDLIELHEHRARVKGFEKAGGSFVEGYLNKLAEVAGKTDMNAATAAYNALSLYKKGELTQASLEAEKVLGSLHKTEKEALTPDKIAELHKEDIKKAFSEGKLTPEKYAEFHEKDYGPLGEFMPEVVEKPKVVKEEPKIVSTPEGKEVSVPMSEKKAEGLSLKKQKAYLAAEVDKAIETAPDIPDIPRMEMPSKYIKPEEYVPEFTKMAAKHKAEINALLGPEKAYVTIRVPGDGEFTVVNEKGFLKRFRDQIKKFPVTAKLKGPAAFFGKPRPSTKPIGKRITGEDVEYYNEFKARKQNLIEREPHPNGTPKQSYGDGFFTDGHYAVKLPEKPKTKKPISTGKKAPDVKTVMPTKGLKEAKVVGEFRGPWPEEAATIVHVIVKDGTEIFLNAKYVDLILTKYPKAKPHVADAGTGVVFKVGKETVGLIMPMRIEGVPGFLQARAAEVAGIKPEKVVAEGEKLEKFAKPEEVVGEKPEVRIADKLIEWKKGEHLASPENFASSWMKYDIPKRKAIIKDLVDRGELPTSFSKRKISDTGKTVTASELLDGLTRKYASDKFKAKAELLSETKSRLLDNIKSEKGSSELINDLSRLGADMIERGYKDFKAFSAEMKRQLGEVWDKIEPLLKKVYSDAKRILKSEMGAVGKGPVYVRLGSLTDEVLSKMNKYLKSLGYDVRGKQDIYEALKGRSLGNGKYAKGLMNKDKEIHHPDWADAYERAWEGAEVRKNKLKIKKEKKVSAANVNWDRIKELGKTSDIREAGYITPEGKYIDLSGKREGGEPGTRSYDHREAGGTVGMQEFMATGNIRMDANSGTLDIAAEPTPAQYKKIDEMVRLHHGKIIVDLENGLGEYSKSNGYYFGPKKTFSHEYSRGTSLAEIKNDIEGFFSGKDIKKTDHKAHLLYNIRNEKGSSELINDLSHLGADAIKRGHKSFKAFAVEMKAVLGDAWAKVKHLMQRAYAGSKKILASEKGAWTIKGKKEEAKAKEPVTWTMEEVEKRYADILKGKPKKLKAGVLSANQEKVSEDAKKFSVAIGTDYVKTKESEIEWERSANRIIKNRLELLETIKKVSKGKEKIGPVEERVILKLNDSAYENFANILKEKNLENINEKVKALQDGLFKTGQDMGSDAGKNLRALRRVKDIRVDVGKAFAGLEREIREQDVDMYNAAIEASKLGDYKPLASFMKYLERTKANPELMDYVYEYWYNCILSGVPTHVVNVASNTAWATWQVGVHRPLLAAIDPIVAKFQKRPTEYYLDEIVPMLAGIRKGYKPGKEAAKEIMTKGYTTEASMDKWALDMGKTIGAFARSPNKYLRQIAPFLTIPTKALRAMDVWANQMGYQAELGAICKRMEKQGKGKFEDLMQNPTEEMQKEAAEYAAYTTFMNEPGKLTKWLEKGRDIVPGGRFVMPFVRTIANLTKRGFEMTPGVGIIAGRKATGREITQVAVKQIEGAMIALALASTVADDRITGNVPADKAEREAFYRQGKLPWAIKIGGKWRQFRRLEPFNGPIAAVAIAHDAWKKTGEVPSTELAFRCTMGIVDNILDSSYLSGLTRVLDSVRRADTAPQKVANMFDRTIASFSPMSSFQRSFVRAFEAMEGEGAVVRKPKGVAETIKVATPGMSEEVAARKNIWGKEVVIPGNPLEQWLPWKAARPTKDVVELEIERLHDKAGLPYPGMPAKYMTARGERIDLTDEQYDRLLVEGGQAAKVRLDRLVGTGYWKTMNDKEKTARIKRILADSRKAARNKLKRELGKTVITSKAKSQYKPKGFVPAAFTGKAFTKFKNVGF
jgi:hypothetical protein